LFFVYGDGLTEALNKIWNFKILRLPQKYDSRSTIKQIFLDDDQV